MIHYRAIGLAALILAFGFGFASLATSANELRSEQVVYHDVRIVI